jgi:hypothetical protein
MHKYYSVLEANLILCVSAVNTWDHGHIRKKLRLYFNIKIGSIRTTWVKIADFIMHVKKQVYSENVMYI